MMEDLYEPGDILTRGDGTKWLKLDNGWARIINDEEEDNERKAQ